MSTEYSATETEDRPIVYIRPISVSELPDEVREQAGDLETVYAIGSEDGKQLALVGDRQTAFVVAREHDMEPVSVH